MQIKKRDGQIEDFDKQKIINAISKAFNSVYGEVDEYAQRKAENIADYIYSYAETDNHLLNIEEIQDLVENGLMNLKDKSVAREYMMYRAARTREREKNTPFMLKVGEKLTASNVVNQNANVDERSFGGRKGEAANELMRKYALDYLISPMESLK